VFCHFAVELPLLHNIALRVSACGVSHLERCYSLHSPLRGRTSCIPSLRSGPTWRIGCHCPLHPSWIAPPATYLRRGECCFIFPCCL